MAAETNTALMDETEVRIAIEKFGRYFGKDTKVNVRLTPDMLGFAEDLALRGLTSAHSREIVDLCTASEQWLEHSVFWRILMFFVDTMSLEIVELNHLENKKTAVLRNRKTSAKPLSRCTKDYIYKIIAKVRGTERMEIQCSLDFLVSRGTADVLAVLRWFLYHVKIECIGIACNLTEAGMNSAVLGRQMETLSKEWRGSTLRIDSLALYFNLAQYREAAEVVKECPWVSVLKMHFIGTDSRETGDINQALKALLLHCPSLEQLSVFKVSIDIEHIRTIAAMLPQLVLLEVGVLTLKKLALDQKNENEAIPVLPGLKTLKVRSLYNYSDAGIESLVCLFPSLKYVQISAKNVTTPLIDTLSSLRFLRTLEILNGFLPIETAEYLLDKLPALEWLSAGVNKLDNSLAHVLSECTGIQTLKLRGTYIPGFLASLLQPSPLMNTLKVLCVCRNSGFYRKGSLSAEDLSSKDTAMKKFGCAVEIIY
ncbi:hypothetical protein NEPAR04_2392 [Nematocida parisii]|nr:hypothetical protein NEPAR04_2392 [Nematocida parisii]